MIVNFMGNPNTIMRPLYDRKPNSRKNFILGVIVNENLKWNCHVDYITANYVLRLLKTAGVQGKTCFSL